MSASVSIVVRAFAVGIIPVLVACGSGTDAVDPVTPPGGGQSVTGPAVIGSLSAKSGAGNSLLEIYGSNMSPAAVVRIGDEIARVTATGPTRIVVDLCIISTTDCEPRGSLAAGGSFPVTIAQNGMTVTAPSRYYLYRSDNFLAGDWTTSVSTTGVVTRFDSAQTFGVVTVAQPPFAVADTVNRRLIRTAPYRWSGEGMLINATTGIRSYSPIIITAVNANSIEIAFTAIGGTAIRNRVNPIR